MRARTPGPSACLLAVALCFAGTAGASAQDGGPPDGLRLPPGPRRSKAFLAQVNAAIDRGVAFLRTRQGPDGRFAVSPFRNFYVEGSESLGATALGVYTLRACGCGFEDADVVRGLQRLRERYDALRKRARGLDTYGVALTVLALEAHYHAEESRDGAPDRYGGAVVVRRRIPEPDLEWLKEMTRWLVAAQTKGGAFSYWSPAQGEVYDNSNTQYALLALKAARRCGVEVPRTVWERALDHFLDEQERKGPAVPRVEDAGVDEQGYGSGAPREVARDQARGWAYRKGSGATGSMTAGGVSSLVICRSELIEVAGFAKQRDPAVVRAIRDGIAWLGEHFTVAENPGPPGAAALKELWHYYYLYGMERAGVLAGVTWMGARDWYLLGAQYLMDAQRDSGGWLGQEALDAVPWKGAGSDTASASLLDTCFALLFLKRATVRVDRGGVATEATDRTLDLTGADRLDEGTFRTVFDAVFRRYVRTEPGDRAERAPDFVRLGTRAVPLLVLRLEEATEAERDAAIDALLRTTGTARGFVPDAPAAARATAVAAWEEWWFLVRDRLRADPEAARFRE